MQRVAWHGREWRSLSEAVREASATVNPGITFNLVRDRLRRKDPWTIADALETPPGQRGHQTVIRRSRVVRADALAELSRIEDGLRDLARRCHELRATLFVAGDNVGTNGAHADGQEEST